MNISADIAHGPVDNALMASEVSPRFLDFIDRLTGGKLLGIFLLVTLVPAIAYVALSCKSAANGLESDHPPITFSDAVYFSIITETTVGYGDIKPLGFSRLLACLQILGGVVLVGIFVAKITTLKGQDFRVAARQAAGTWLVINDVPSMEAIVTVAEIRFEGNRIDYSGSNYSLDGDFLGMFTSDFIDVNGHQLRFRYTNADSVTDYFSQGVSTLRFSEHKGKWVYYSASARDAGKMKPITFQGWRADLKECEQLMTSREERRDVVSAFAKSHRMRKIRPAKPDKDSA